MRGGLALHAPGLRLKLVVAFYVLATALLPLGHHDVVCHLKSSTHCNSCLVGSSGESAAQLTMLGACTLKDAGHTLTFGVRHFEFAPHTVRSGRAPPAA